MDRETITGALTALGARLLDRGVSGDLYVVGGAAMALAYDERRATRDVDALFVPKVEIYRAAQEIAADLGLPDDWLNDGVKGFLHGPDPFPTQVLDLPGLRVEVASPQAVLVLKAMAHRTGEDEADLLLLATTLGLDAGKVLDLVEQTVGSQRLTAQTEFFVRAVLDPA